MRFCASHALLGRSPLFTLYKLDRIINLIASDCLESLDDLLASDPFLKSINNVIKDICNKSKDASLVCL